MHAIARRHANADSFEGPMAACLYLIDNASRSGLQAAYSSTCTLRFGSLAHISAGPQVLLLDHASCLKAYCSIGICNSIKVRFAAAV